MGKINDVVVVIPIYKSGMNEFEKRSFLRMISVFKNRDINIVSPYSIKAFVNSLIKDYDNMSVTFFDDFFLGSINGYNRLLMSKVFYSNYSLYTYVLICQLDVYVIKDDLDYWMSLKMDNIGAPIFEGYSNATNVLKPFGGNGGFCLRNIKSCVEVLNNVTFRYSKLSSLLQIESLWYWKLYRLIKNGLIFNYNFLFFKPRINEDIFWSMIVPIEYKLFKCCKPEKAKYFAFDANPRLLYEMCEFKYPMAIHAWWRYDLEFVLGIIKEIESV